jgi:coenzyme F420-reducing hydrogenase beta subunit
LTRPSPERNTPQPADIRRAGLCIGCGSCVAQSNPERAIMGFDRFGQLTPRGAEGGERFLRTCPFSPLARNEDQLAARLFPTARAHDGAIGRFEAAYVGHVAEGDFRTTGSSGGLTSWVAAELLRQGLIDGVAHVSATVDPAPGEPLFRYRISRRIEDLTAGAKSRYYPVDLSGVLREIAGSAGHYAIVGVPCFVKAIHLLREEDPVLRERIAFTLGLFCGHMKSARMVESFAWQMGAAGDDVRAIDFRLKDPTRPANWYRASLDLRSGETRAQDWWHLADGDWGAGFLQHAACDVCDDVVAETADVSFGDAWVEPYASDGRGTNVVVVRSPEVADLLRQGVADGRLALTEVDAEFIRETQAAGLRQRREGLSLRLATRRRPAPPKRVAPVAAQLPARRRLVYRLRRLISFWSHRVFFAARQLRWRGLYIGWARASLRLYQGVTYSRGSVGALCDGLERALGRLSPRNPA